MRRAGLNSRGTNFYEILSICCFADDMDIVGRIFEKVADLYTRLKREAVKVGLVVNAAKTKYMLAGGAERSLLTADNNVSREIRRRIIIGSRTYYGLHKKLR